ncbi:CoA protein activase [Desulfotomaculum copahuensis]|uniref:CoA protein activase n=1 Tax=Desulfotomaculum copahuensis TaxID=1838280 RepID=A0A1B7LJ06_9FIRM|nr:CoA protein activase [Desulfotomaculum copahuensis]OAT86555.1 CoA protein activase [Desulfotomaculum copahuensis]
MKVTFPHMGHAWICLSAMLEYLGVSVVVPPPSSKRTLTLGVKHGPEFACLPLKLNLGNFIEAREAGADTVLMAGGCGPCRFGYYAQVEHAILEDLGHHYRLVVMEPPQRHIGELLAKIKYVTGQSSWWQVVQGIRFGYCKARAVDELEMAAHRLRPREAVPGATSAAFKDALRVVVQAGRPADMPAAVARAREIMAAVAVEARPVLRVGIVGEIYTLLEPFANLDIERRLGELGVEVDRSIYLSEWINDHLFLGLLRNMRSRRAACRAAAPYLNHCVGGHGQETVGSTVLYARAGYDGVIQLLPFTCMPEIVAHSILPRLDIPTLTLTMDEQSGEAGLVTRLEAFVDLLEQRGKRRVSLPAAAPA